MSIWTCDDYTIEKVYVKTTTQGTEAGSMKGYAVDIQRSLLINILMKL